MKRDATIIDFSIYHKRVEPLREAESKATPSASEELCDAIQVLIQRLQEAHRGR